MIKKISSCRVCKRNNFQKVFDFGPTPFANEFLKKSDIDKGELYFPLEVLLCKDCYFLTLGHVGNPKILFGNYVYVSSTSKVFIKHFEKFANDFLNKYQFHKKPFVIDIGSNDGILLKPFLNKGIKVLGVEPAKHIAKIARKEGINTIDKYFTQAVARQIVNKHGHADLVTATNVFAHIDNLDEVISGIKILLNKEGIFMIEAPYLIDFFKKNYFDLVYHEHLSYWSIHSLVKIFERFDMTVFDVEYVPVHGGTIRVYVKKNTASHKVSKIVHKMELDEKKFGLRDIKTYINFQMKILKNKAELVGLLATLKKQGKSIAGYGAPAKGNTLLNYFGIGRDMLDFIVDEGKFKQGFFTPGKRIPVVSSEYLNNNIPNYILILAWNFQKSIIDANSHLKKKGVKFISPVPHPKVL